MDNKIYKYNENLIINLGLVSIVEKYNFNNSDFNEVIYYAFSALDSHLKELATNDIKTFSLLIGDYYNFVYYDKLKNNLDLLYKFSTYLAECYKKLALRESLEDSVFISELGAFSFNLFYNAKLDSSDEVFLKKKFRTYYERIFLKLFCEKDKLEL